MRRLSVPVLAVLAVFAAASAVAAPAPAAAAGRAAPAPAGRSGSVTAALERAFEAARHVPGSAVGGIRAGTLHVGAVNGRQWAIASFSPAKSAAEQVAAGFQDGAATGVFANVGGSWRLVRTGPYGCGDGLPAALRKAWHLGGPAACATTAKPATATVRAAQDQATTLGGKIAAIALTQVGVGDTPVSTSFGMDCDPYSTLVAGFSANSDGCGYDSAFNVRNENETWCSDFNKWVWEQAGVTTDMNTLNAGSVSFYDWARDQGEPLQADTGTPRAGDSIVFFSPGSYPGYADHVGIVTAVNPDGTINMVNGDFGGGPNIGIQYDTEIALTSWAASVWGPGEEWFLVTPPATVQDPSPSGALSGPRTAVTGTAASFRASGTVPGSTVTAYYWTFGDGRTTNATGTHVTHVFSEPGTYTVSVTLTSGYGTIVTLEQDVRVLASSAEAASVPSDALWYATTPVLRYVFTRSAGGLAVDSWDGESWLQYTVPGDPAATGNITALSYPDAAADDGLTPHAYYRAADGSLAETYLSGSGWVTGDLPGTPAAGASIVATATASGDPAVFYVDTAGNLAETALKSGDWRASELPRGGPPASAASLALADTASGPVLFTVGPAGTIRVTSADGGFWSGNRIPAKTTPGGSLAAVTTPDGHAAVVYLDAHGRGLAEAAETGRTTAGRWEVTRLPGSPAPGTTLAATTYLLPSAVYGPPGSFPQPPGSLTPSGPAEPLGTEVFYRTAAGAPAVTFGDGYLPGRRSAPAGWQTAALPGTAASIAGADADPVAYQPSEVYLADGGGGLAEDTTGAGASPSGTWTTVPLPGTPATFADRVVLYAATPADKAAAQAAAAAAGLPAGQVTSSFATAWADTLSGDYLVIAVGLAATDGLYFNVCGWDNPSTEIPGSTPFYIVNGPLDRLPGADAYEEAAAGTAASTQARASDLAYYAVHGALPPGVTSVPARVSPQYACSGSPS